MGRVGGGIRSRKDWTAGDVLPGVRDKTTEAGGMSGRKQGAIGGGSWLCVRCWAWSSRDAPLE